MSSDANIARRLRESAEQYPDTIAIAEPAGARQPGPFVYRELTFADLEDLANRLAAGLSRMGVGPGRKMVLFVPFGIEFIALTFALFRAGATIVLIDPGMGRTNIFACLEEVQPDGFVAIPKVHAARCVYRRRFAHAKLNVTVGRRWFWGGATFDGLRLTDAAGFQPHVCRAGDPAGIIFTSGSTGAPKGVLYEHGMFDAQVDLIRNQYLIEPGEVDLPGFPLFGLFNAAMGVTTVIPDMDPTRPAEVDPAKIIKAIRERNVTQAFGSPAFWNRVGRYCEEQGITLPTLRRALSAGGPVPNHVLRRMSRALTADGADLFTPYGATESLPVASIGAREVLEQTAARTSEGGGTCVGRMFCGIDVKIIEITNGPIESLDSVRELPAGGIGEIIVRGPSVTREYYHHPEATRLAKIPDPPGFWHRIGDVGYRDEADLLWFCGRKAHIVETDQGRMFSVCCEAIFNEHPDVYRCALVGLDTKPRQRPAIVVEPEPGRFPHTPGEQDRLRTELLKLAAGNELTRQIETVLFHESLPVDTRHNVKINREALAEWAADQSS